MSIPVTLLVIVVARAPRSRVGTALLGLKRDGEAAAYGQGYSKLSQHLL